MEINELTGLILKKAFEVHTVLGPGLLESTYEECLCYELAQCNTSVERQKALPIIYKDTMFVDVPNNRSSGRVVSPLAAGRSPTDD